MSVGANRAGRVAGDSPGAGPGFGADRRQPWPLVGREGQLQTIGWALRDPRVQGVVIRGRAGTGKSRLAEEGLRLANAQGFRTARAVATAAAATVPLGAVAHLIPAGVDLSDPVTGFAAVTAALGRRGQSRLAVLIDDLPLLDATSVVLLRQLMDADAVFLIGTVRSGERPGEWTALQRGDEVHQLKVAELDEDEVAEVLRGVLGRRVASRAVHELFKVSGGNALYLRELVLGAMENGTLADDGGVWELLPGWRTGTERLTEAIDARLSRAPADARPALELLALCEPVALADAESTVSTEELAELERLGLIRVAQDGKRWSVTLAHPLYGEVLRARIPELRRRAVLLGQAGRLEEHGARRHDDLLHIASWRLSATGTAAPEQLRHAAVLARHGHDYPKVVTLLQALPDVERSVQDLLLLGDVLVELGRAEEADKVLAAADALAGNEWDQLAVVVTRAMNALWGMVWGAEALRLNEAGQQALTSPESQWVLTVNRGCILGVIGRFEESLALLEETLGREAEKALDLDLWLFGATVKTWALATTGRTEQAVAWAKHAHATHQRLHRRARRAPPPATQLVGEVLALAEAGRIAEARSLGERVGRELAAGEAPVARIWAAFSLARVEWLAGHPARARDEWSECAAFARVHHLARPLIDALGGVACANVLLGDQVATRGALAELDSVEAQPRRRSGDPAVVSPDRALAEAWSEAAAGRLARARSVLLTAAAGLREMGHLAAEGMLLTDHARLGGAAEAAPRLAEIAERADGPLPRLRASFAAALAANDADTLVAVSAELEAIGCDLLAAEAAAAAAAAYLADGRTRQATAASVRSAQAAARCEGAVTPGLAAAETTAPLTRREREIALLAAAGAASQDIAEQLVLSVRTVENHLHSVYSKLGVANRRELAHRLEPPQAEPSREGSS